MGILVEPAENFRFFPTAFTGYLSNSAAGVGQNLIAQEHVLLCGAYLTYRAFICAHE
jgi:hypothetical protein